MKKVNVLFAGMFFFLLTFAFTSQAQNQDKDFFIGKWDVLVEGTPNGDGKMAVNLERKDGKLTGTVLAPGKSEPSKISRVEEKAKTVTLYFNTSGYDVYLVMEKKDENSFTGSLMDMFDATGKRVIPAKAKL